METTSCEEAPYLCPRCERAVPFMDVNQDKGMALCRTCGIFFDVSAEQEDRENVEILQKLPKRTVMEELPEGWSLKLGNRQWSAIVALIFLIPFFGVPVFMLVTMSMGKNTGNAAPLFAFLFLIAFMIIPTIVLLISLHSLVGYHQLILKDGRGILYSGIGRLRRKKEFFLEPKTRLFLETTHGKNGSRTHVCIDGQKRILFGAALNDGQRDYAIAFLRCLKG